MTRELKLGCHFNPELGTRNLLSSPLLLAKPCNRKSFHLERGSRCRFRGCFLLFPCKPLPIQSVQLGRQSQPFDLRRMHFLVGECQDKPVLNKFCCQFFCREPWRLVPDVLVFQYPGYGLFAEFFFKSKGFPNAFQECDFGTGNRPILFDKHEESLEIVACIDNRNVHVFDTALAHLLTKLDNSQPIRLHLNLDNKKERSEVGPGFPRKVGVSKGASGGQVCEQNFPRRDARNAFSIFPVLRPFFNLKSSICNLKGLAFPLRCPSTVRQVFDPEGLRPKGSRLRAHSAVGLRSFPAVCLPATLCSGFGGG